MPSSQFQLDQRYETGEDGVIIHTGGSTTTISNETVTQASETDTDELTELILETRPEISDLIIDWKNNNANGSSSDLLDYLNSLEEDGDDDPETIVITNTYTKTLFFEQLRDIAFEVEGDVRIFITMNGSTVLDNIYTPSFDGLVHLDLQDLVRDNTVNYLSSICPDEDLVLDSGFVAQLYAHSRLYVRVTHAAGNVFDDYYFTVCGFESGAEEKCTDIDFLRIPRNYLLPLSTYMETAAQPYSDVFLYLESGQRQQLLGSVEKPFHPSEDYTPGNALIFSKDIPISAVPARSDEQFRLSLVSDGTRPQTNHLEGATFHRKISSPVLKICPGEFQQYIFLNKYGHYDNIPMSGAKTYAPEYDIENADRSYSVQKVRSTKREVYTQNTGPQTRATLEALAELLLSPEIFHYIPGKSIHRIVVENPTLTINSKNSINSATFSWRYAGK